jgi:glycine/D-amino acid oxidase-like deaminating enzyme
MAQVHPFKFTTSMLALAEESGAKLVQGQATSLNSNSISYKADDNVNPVDIPADTIIVTAGPWTPTLLPQVQISTSRAHSIVIEPKNQLPAQAIFFSYSSATYRHAISPELYSRPSSVYICGPTDSHHALPEYAKDVKTLEKQTSELEQFAKEISTDLEEGKVVVRQACYLPFHERGFPAIGWSSAPRKGKAGVFVAAGHAVWGISLAPGTGKVVAEMVMGGNEGKGEGWDVRKLAP